MKRILWWGERTPYWGDSFVASKIDYRKDTPLQCTIGGVAGAQCIIFGMFGVEVMLDGSIKFNPSPPSFSEQITLKGLILRNHRIDIDVDGSEYKVVLDDIFIHSKVGTPVVFKDGKLIR